MVSCILGIHPFSPYFSCCIGQSTGYVILEVPHGGTSSRTSTLSCQSKQALIPTIAGVRHSENDDDSGGHEIIRVTAMVYGFRFSFSFT